MADLIETKRTAHRLLHEHGLDAKGWTFKYDRSLSRGGQCIYGDRTISLSKHLVPLWEDDQVMETLLHEIAHAIVGPGHGHGSVWRACARRLGSTGARTHSNATVEKRYAALCPKCDRVIARRHRVRKEMRYATHTQCGTIIRWIDNSLTSA